MSSFPFLKTHLRQDNIDLLENIKVRSTSSRAHLFLVGKNKILYIELFDQC